MPVATARPRPGYLVPLTMSGNEITDRNRWPNPTQGDGLAEDGSTGIWPAATNLCLNGGFESNTTGWTTYNGTSGTATLARDNAHSKFGSWACKLTTDGASNNQQLDGSGAGSGAASPSTQYTGSCWIFSVSGGEVMQLGVNEYLSGTYVNYLGGSLFTLVPGWQRIAVTVTTGGVSLNQLGLVVGTRATGAGQAVTVWVDGVQVETGPIATPYIETNGGTATRNATDSMVSCPVAGLFTPTQGWIAMRFRINWNISDTPASNRLFFQWAQDGNNRFVCFSNNSNGKHIEFFRSASNVADDVQSANSFAKGDVITVVCGWNAGGVNISFNGNFATGGASNIPTISTASFDLGAGGSVSSARQAYSDYFWAATGSGLLTSGHAALLNAIGNDKGRLYHLPSEMGLTGVWDGRDANFRKVH